MTTSEIEDAARNKYNAVNDAFYTSAEILQYMYEACLDMNLESFIIEALSTSTTSTASTQAYAFPTNAIAIKRVTYAGKKLKPITMREDDLITGLNQATTETGTPQYYFAWNRNIYLRPVPSASSDTIAIYSFNQPAVITAGSTLEIPVQFHMDIVNFIVAEMAAKDSNYTAAQYYRAKWESAKVSAKRYAKKKNRGDSFSAVQNEEMLIDGYLGTT